MKVQVGLVVALAWPSVAFAFSTPFGEIVNASIDRGLDYFRAQQQGDALERELEGGQGADDDEHR